MPPSKTQDDQAIKANLNYTLAQLYLQGGALDLARERLNLVAADEAQTSGMNDEFLKNLTKQLTELNQRVEQVQSQMEDMATSTAGPLALDKASLRQGQRRPPPGDPRTRGANDAGGNIPGVRPMLVDLYCDAGQPDKALDVIFNLNIDDPTLSSGIGHRLLSPGDGLFPAGQLHQRLRCSGRTRRSRPCGPDGAWMP